MGNQCCTSVRYTEAQFNEMYFQKANLGHPDQSYFRNIDNYNVSCGQNRVILKKNNSIVSDKSVYEILLLIHDLFSNIEDQPHQLFVTENLVSFFRNNPKQITNRIVVDSLVELLSEQFSNEKILQLIEDSNKNSRNKNLSFDLYAQSNGLNIASMNQINPHHQSSKQQYQNGLQNKYNQQGYTPINDYDQHGLPRYQTGYHDNSPIINNYDQQNDFPVAVLKEEIKDFDPIVTNDNTLGMQQMHQQNNQYPQQYNQQYNQNIQHNNNIIDNNEESQIHNYSHRVYNNPNTMYKSGFQQPQTQEDTSNLNSQLNQLQLSTKRLQVVDQNVTQILEFIMSKMGTHQLEQTSQKDIWQIWRIFDPTTGFMNYHKKYNLLYYSKQAMQIYQKEATVLQQIEDAQINVTPRLMKYDAKNKEIKFEGGYCTLWEYSIEMAKLQQRFSEKDLIYMTLELVRMVIELEKMSIYHGNIKPQNIVLIQTAEGKYQIRLINFESCVRNAKERYPNTKTENYYDIIHKFRVQSDIMSSQIYQIGRTILNIIIKQGFNNNLLHLRKNHPLITPEALKQYQNEYPTIINIISKMLRTTTQQGQQMNQQQNLAQSKTAGNLTDRNRDENNQSLPYASTSQTLNSFGIVYTMQQLERDLHLLREAVRSGQQQNYIADTQGLVKQIGRRRIEMGAWDQSMTPDIFKRELMYILSLGQYERGCELCNYLLNFKSSPNYNLNNSSLKSSQINTQRLNNQQQDLNNNQMLNQYPLYLKNQVSTILKQDLNKYLGYQHEFLVKVQQVFKQLYSRQLGEIVQAYLHAKEELSLFYFSHNMLKEAITEQEQLIQEKRNLMDNDHVGLSKSQRILGEFYLRAGKNDQSLKYLTQSLNQISSVYRDLMHLEIAETLISMSEVYSHQNDTKRAVQSAMIAYEISSLTSPNSLAFAEICIQISQIFMRIYNDHGKSIPYLEKGVKIKIDCFKDTFLNQYLDLNILQLASYFESTKNYVMANEYYNILLEIRLKRLSPQITASPQVAQAYTLIGFILEKINQIDNAQANHVKALTMRKQLYGEVHLEVADSLINVSMIHLRKNQFQEALTLQEQALKIKEKLMPESSDVAQCMNNLAILLETLGNFEESINYHQKSIAIKKKIHGDNSSSIATSYNNLALTYKNSGQHDKAIPLLNQALQIRQQIDPNSEEVISVLTNLQAINQDLGNIEQANKYQEQINNIKSALTQKKEQRERSMLREEQLIYRTTNAPSNVYNQSLIASANNQQNSQNFNVINKLNSNISNSQGQNLHNQINNNSGSQQMQYSNGLQNNLQNSILQDQLNQQANFMNQAGNQSQQLGQLQNNTHQMGQPSIVNQNSQGNQMQSTQLNKQQISGGQMNQQNNYGSFNDIHNSQYNQNGMKDNQHSQAIADQLINKQQQSQQLNHQNTIFNNYNSNNNTQSMIQQQQSSQYQQQNPQNNIFIPNSQNNQNAQNINQSQQISQSRNMGNYTQSQFAQNHQMQGSGGPLYQPNGISDNMKQSNNSLQYQNNRPAQLQGVFDANLNNQRAQ